LRSTVTNQVVLRLAIAANKVAHILDQPQHRRFKLAEETHRFAGIIQGYFLMFAT